MKKQTLKAIGIAFIGLLIWILLVYIAIAFYKAELNPFTWSQGVRAAFIYVTVCFLVFAPIIVNELKD
jgi:hypothetical protein